MVPTSMTGLLRPRPTEAFRYQRQAHASYWNYGGGFYGRSAGPEPAHRDPRRVADPFWAGAAMSQMKFEIRDNVAIATTSKFMANRGEIQFEGR